MARDKFLGNRFRKLILLLLVFTALAFTMYWRWIKPMSLMILQARESLSFWPPGPVPMPWMLKPKPGSHCNRTALCDSDTGNVEVVVVIFSGSRNSLRRQAQRETWLSNRWKKELPFRHVFLLGGRNNETNDDEWKSMYTECAYYGDMIVSQDYVDSYYNLSFKALSMLQLAAETCTNTRVRYLFKVDDDTMVNLPNLQKAISKTEEAVGKDEAFMAGGISKNDKPSRKTQDKYYVSEKEYSGKKYPPLVHGPAYVLNMQAVNVLLHVVPNVTMIHLEDVYMALLADAAGIHLHDPTGFHIGWSPSWRFMRVLVSSHGADPALMRRLWRESFRL